MSRGSFFFPRPSPVSCINRFAALIRKYTSFEKLARFMLHELIDRITIYETPGMGRCRKGKEKRITIRRYYDLKYKEVNKHQHKRALALTARKLVRLVFRLLKDNRLYKPPGG